MAFGSVNVPGSSAADLDRVEQKADEALSAANEATDVSEAAQKAVQEAKQALDAHTESMDNPHAVTAEQVKAFQEVRSGTHQASRKANTLYGLILADYAGGEG